MTVSGTAESQAAAEPPHGEAGPIRIRRAGPADAPALSLIGTASFLESYLDMIPVADMLLHCQQKHDAAVYAAWLARADAALWLAEHPATGAPAGYAVLLPASLPVGAADPRDMELLRIYLLARFHGQALGHRLMQAVLDEARARAARRVVLGTSQQNRRALDFYAREGFNIIGQRQFTVGTAIFADHVLARVL